MDDFGDLFGGLADAAAGLFGWRAAGREGGDGDEPRSETATYDRVLTGGRRDLDINDR